MIGDRYSQWTDTDPSAWKNPLANYRNSAALKLAGRTKLSIADFMKSGAFPMIDSFDSALYLTP